MISKLRSVDGLAIELFNQGNTKKSSVAVVNDKLKLSGVGIDILLGAGNDLFFEDDVLLGGLTSSTITVGSNNDIVDINHLRNVTGNAIFTGNVTFNEVVKVLKGLNISNSAQLTYANALLTLSSSQNLELKAGNQVNQLHLSSGGNVGIGTNRANKKLHVVGNIQVDSSTSIGLTNVTRGAIVLTGHDITLGIDSNEIFCTNDLHIGTTNDNDVKFVLGGSERVTFFGDGNVAIGTNVHSSHKLKIVGDIMVGDNTSYNNVIIRKGSSINGYSGVIEYASNTTATSGIAKYASYFKSNKGAGTTRHDMIIDGYVGIGKNNPSSALDVAGDIRVSGTLFGNIQADTGLISGWNLDDNSIYDMNGQTGIRMKGSNNQGNAIIGLYKDNNNYVMMDNEGVKCVKNGNVIGSAISYEGIYGQLLTEQSIPGSKFDKIAPESPKRVECESTIEQMATGEFVNIDVSWEESLEESTNMLTNGNFVTTEGWRREYCNLSVANNIGTFTGTSSSIYYMVGCLNTTRYTSAELQNQSIFLKCKIRIKSAGCERLFIGIANSLGNISTGYIDNPIIDEWYDLYGIVSYGSATGTSSMIKIYSTWSGGGNSGKVMEIKECLSINLGDILGNQSAYDVDTCNGMFNYYASDLAGYKIYLKDSATGSNYIPQGIVSKDTTDYTIRGVIPNRAYYVGVSSYDVTGNESAITTSNIFNTIKDSVAPDRVENFVSVVGAKMFALRWDAVVTNWGEDTECYDVDYYELQRKVYQLVDGNMMVIEDWRIINKAYVTNVIDKDVEYDYRYSYRVRAVDTSGNYAISGGEEVWTLVDAGSPSKVGVADIVAGSITADVLNVGSMVKSINSSKTMLFHFDGVLTSTQGLRPYNFKGGSWSDGKFGDAYACEKKTINLISKQTSGNSGFSNGLVGWDGSATYLENEGISNSGCALLTSIKILSVTLDVTQGEDYALSYYCKNRHISNTGHMILSLDNEEIAINELYSDWQRYFYRFTASKTGKITLSFSGDNGEESLIDNVQLEEGNYSTTYCESEIFIDADKNHLGYREEGYVQYTSDRLNVREGIVSFWFKPSWIGVNEQTSTLFSWGEDTDNSIKWLLRIDVETDNRIKLTLKGNGHSYELKHINTLQLLNWNQVTVRWVFDTDIVGNNLSKQLEGNFSIISNNTLNLLNTASDVSNYYKDMIVRIVEGTGVGQERTIISYNGATKIATLDRGWEVSPNNSSKFEIVIRYGAEIFLNGTESEEKINLNFFGRPDTGADIFTIGNRIDGGYCANGAFDEFRIDNSVEVDIQEKEEIISWYKQGSTFYDVNSQIDADSQTISASNAKVTINNEGITIRDGLLHVESDDGVTLIGGGKLNINGMNVGVVQGDSEVLNGDFSIKDLVYGMGDTYLTTDGVQSHGAKFWVCKRSSAYAFTSLFLQSVWNRIYINGFISMDSIIEGLIKVYTYQVMMTEQMTKELETEVRTYLSFMQEGMEKELAVQGMVATRIQERVQTLTRLKGEELLALGISYSMYKDMNGRNVLTLLKSTQNGTIQKIKHTLNAWTGKFDIVLDTETMLPIFEDVEVGDTCLGNTIYEVRPYESRGGKTGFAVIGSDPINFDLTMSMDEQVVVLEQDLHNLVTYTDGLLDKGTYWKQHAFTFNTKWDNYGVKGTVISSTANTITLDSNAFQVDNLYTGVVIEITGGIGVGQERVIVSYDGMTRTAVLNAPFGVVPNSESGYWLKAKSKISLEVEEFLPNYDVDSNNHCIVKPSYSVLINDSCRLGKDGILDCLGDNLSDKHQLILGRVSFTGGDKENNYTLESVRYANYLPVMNIRYIRDWVSGTDNTLLTGKYWSNISIIDITGAVILLDADMISCTQESTIINKENLFDVIGNNPNISTYCEVVGEGAQYIQIDLGKVHSMQNGNGIGLINIIHLFNGIEDITCSDTRTQVSEDGIKWYDIYNSDYQGLYVEQMTGHTLGGMTAEGQMGSVIVEELFFDEFATDMDGNRLYNKEILNRDKRGTWEVKDGLRDIVITSTVEEDNKITSEHNSDKYITSSSVGDTIFLRFKNEFSCNANLNAVGGPDCGSGLVFLDNIFMGDSDTSYPSLIRNNVSYNNIMAGEHSVCYINTGDAGVNTLAEVGQLMFSGGDWYDWSSSEDDSLKTVVEFDGSDGYQGWVKTCIVPDKTNTKEEGFPIVTASNVPIRYRVRVIYTKPAFDVMKSTVLVSDIQAELGVSDSFTRINYGVDSFPTEKIQKFDRMIPKSGITSQHLQEYTALMVTESGVRERHIADYQVTSTKYAIGSVINQALADENITKSKLNYREKVKLGTNVGVDKYLPRLVIKDSVHNLLFNTSANIRFILDDIEEHSEIIYLNGQQQYSNYDEPDDYDYSIERVAFAVSGDNVMDIIYGYKVVFIEEKEIDFRDRIYCNYWLKL